jgi:hypothetical protein
MPERRVLGLRLIAGSIGLSIGSLGVTSPAFVAATAAALWATQPEAGANAELDRKYALETVGALKAWDNVDGLFADYVTAAYKEYFAGQTRFRLQDLGKADALLGTSKVPYSKAIEDAEILGQLSRSLKMHSLLRTRVFKEGPRYRFTIDWLHAPQMEVLATETFNLEDQGASQGAGNPGRSDARDFAGLGDIKGRLQIALTKLFAQVPFVGHVTGRDQGDVTVNLGAVSGIRRGDTLVIGTIDEVKRHPLLKQIVEWRIANVGKVDVDSVDEALAFGHVTDQEEGREIARYQKILRVIPRPEKTASGELATVVETNPIDEPPKLGYGMVSAWTGFYSRQFSSTTGPVSNSGSGLLYGARGTGEIWLNREFFFNLAMGYGAFGFSQNDITTGVATPGGSVSGSIFSLSGSLGYTYLITGDFFGPRAWVKTGYRIDSITLPTLIAPEELAPYSVKSFYVGIGGDLPIRHNYGARLDLEFGVFNSGSQTGGSSGSANTSHNASISVAGYYRYRPRITFQGALEIHGTGSEFGTTASLSQKTITILPSVQYLF